MQKSNVYPASVLLGDCVRNVAGENVGKIEELLIDPAMGSIQYAERIAFDTPGVRQVPNDLYAIQKLSKVLGPETD